MLNPFIEYFIEQIEGTEERLIVTKRYLSEVIVSQLASRYGVATCCATIVIAWSPGRHARRIAQLPLL